MLSKNQLMFIEFGISWMTPLYIRKRSVPAQKNVPSFSITHRSLKIELCVVSWSNCQVPFVIPMKVARITLSTLQNKPAGLKPPPPRNGNPLMIFWFVISVAPTNRLPCETPVKSVGSPGADQAKKPSLPYTIMYGARLTMPPLMPLGNSACCVPPWPSLPVPNPATCTNGAPCVYTLRAYSGKLAALVGSWMFCAQCANSSMLPDALSNCVSNCQLFSGLWLTLAVVGLVVAGNVGLLTADVTPKLSIVNSSTPVWLPTSMYRYPLCACE